VNRFVLLTLLALLVALAFDTRYENAPTLTVCAVK
jgi:hypothetical protein